MKISHFLLLAASSDAFIAPSRSKRGQFAIIQQPSCGILSKSDDVVVAMVEDAAVEATGLETSVSETKGEINGDADEASGPEASVSEENEIGEVSQKSNERQTSSELKNEIDEAANGANGPKQSSKEEEEVDEAAEFDKKYMRQAIQLAQSCGGERGAASPYPKPIGGAVIVTKSGKVLGQGRSNYLRDCVQAATADAGIEATPLREWCVSWPKDRQLRKEIAESTLYVTLEPSCERKGDSLPPITQLIEMSGIPRVVIGCQDPVPERAAEGAGSLHSAGIHVTMGVEQEDCENLISQYTTLANSKLQRMARKHLRSTGRPLGFLHCSVIDSQDAEAFARNGNAFGKDFGGVNLSFRDFGAYEVAPPPESIWAAEAIEDDFTTEFDEDFLMEFDDEEFQESLGTNPMMPWYEQVDAVVATFPQKQNGPSDDNSVKGRLKGLKWLATTGKELPANVERILAMDATDLPDLPLSNDDPNLPSGVDVEEFWRGNGRRPTRLLLRHGDNLQAQAAATAAARAAEAAAAAAKAAADAIEVGDAGLAAEAALECQQAAMAATDYIQQELQKMQDLKMQLTKLGVKVEIVKGGEPIDIMKHLGKRSGYKAVVWRAGCWGSRGVETILAGAFQWVSAHIAVDAVGGKFWQLMLAERAVQAACGTEQKVKIFADQEDIALEYCDDESADPDCVLSVGGRPVRHVRLDCRVALVDPDRPREFVLQKTAPMKEHQAEEGPWFL